MKAFVEGTLRIVEDGSFTDKETKKEVKRFINYVQDDFGQLEKFSSGEVDYSSFIGRPALFTVEIRLGFQQQSLFRITLTDVKPS